MPNEHERIREAVRAMARRYNTARRNHLDLAAEDTARHMKQCMDSEKSSGYAYELGYGADLLITSIIWNGVSYTV